LSIRGLLKPKNDILITHTNGSVYLWQMNGIAIQTGTYLPPECRFGLDHRRSRAAGSSWARGRGGSRRKAVMQAG
jgi:hypothetical protein